MAEPKKPTPSVDEPTPIPGSLAAPTDDGIRRQVAAWVNATRAGARRCRIVVEFSDEDRDTLAVPLTVQDDLESHALEVLGRLRPGEWIKGQTLAAEIGIDDRQSGHFRRLVAKLLDGERVESSRSGYRLK